MMIGKIMVSLSVAAVFAWAAGAGSAGAGSAGAAPAPSSLQGQRIFIRCASCHAINTTAIGKIGPSLAGVVGRKNASLPGYAYSPAMKAKSFNWDEATLDHWLERPSAVVPGTSMAFAGLSNPADRKALIAYLKKPGK